MNKRYIKTKYEGVYYINGYKKGLGRIFYIKFKINKKLYFEKVGNSYIDKLTSKEVSLIRAKKIILIKYGENNFNNNLKVKNTKQKNITLEHLFEEYWFLRKKAVSLKTYKNYFHFKNKHFKNILNKNINEIPQKKSKK